MFIRTIQAVLLTALVALHATAAQDAKAEAKAKMSSLKASAAKLIHSNAAKGATDSCQNHNLIVRKEWYIMTQATKLSD